MRFGLALQVQLVFVLMAFLPAIAGENLVFNSSFEMGSEFGGPAEGWDTPNCPEGGINQPTARKARTGRFCHQIAVPKEASVTWYQVTQEIVGASSGQTLTLSVYVQTENVHDGAGAYCSINCFNIAGSRIAYFDAQAKITGTVTQWQRQSVTATIPRGTTRVLVILTLHGRGTAYFDDVQLEKGEVATDYRPSSADIEAMKQSERERKEAEEFFRTVKVETGKRGVVAILNDNLPADGIASSPQRFGKWLLEAGYSVVYLNALQVSNRFILCGPRGKPVNGGVPIDLLVLPYGGSFPASAIQSIKSFLRQDGAFFSTGGYAFDSLLVRYDGKWYRPKDLPMPNTPVVSVLNFDDGVLGDWSLGSDEFGSKPVLTLVKGRKSGYALQFAVARMHRWSTAVINVKGKLPKDWEITRFFAKGDANTKKIAIEWHEKDGSRWKANVPITTEWKEYVLRLSDFSYWPDNPSVGRGGVGDRLRPENVVALLIGVAADIAAADQPHTFWIDDVSVQPDPMAHLRTEPPCLNTRYAEIRDAMWPRPDQIPVFDPSHRLRWVVKARVLRVEGADKMPLLKGPFEGYSAVGMISNQGHGFGPNLSRLIPLVEGYDRFGRYRGLLGSIMHTYDGYYAGASWAFFGVTNKDLFSDEFPQAKKIFLHAVEELLRRIYLHDTDTEFSSYRPGETARLRTRVSNFGRRSAEVKVRFAVLPYDGFGTNGACFQATNCLFEATKSLRLEAGETERVVVDWKVPEEIKLDFCLVRVSLFLDGKMIDQEENGFVIWLPERFKGARYAPVGKHGAYFVFGDRPMFLIGCQSYWGQNGSVTARSPLAFERDFAMMRDYGLHFSRAFIPFRTESERRQSDAIVQLAQKHQILLYHAPNLHNTVVAEELAEQAKIAREIGERYRGIPWLIVDICNEPSFSVEDEKLQPAFNEFLRQKYGTTERLRQAWGFEVPEIGKVKLEKLSDRWDDIRSYDTHLFLAISQQRWASHNRNALLSADSSRLASVGFAQYYDAERVRDALIGSRELDFTDIHYYGPLVGFPTQFKDIDMRVLGKPMVLGECGAKEHPTFVEKDPWGLGETPEQYCKRFLYIVHHAFGLGGAALSSWHWRDPMEGIFPCGLVHSDRVPRMAASVMRAMAFAFGMLRPRYETPQVLIIVPENHRLGGSRVAVTNALHRAEELLMSCNVDFGLISENQIERIPEGVRALVYPLPYCPPDETVSLLKQFVQKGGALYFSGDISYDEQRKLTREKRLLELAGVERIGEQYPNIARENGATVRLKPATAFKFAEGEAKPAIKVRTVDAEVLATDENGEPVIAIRRLGKGFVVFCADPIEISPEVQKWHRALYMEFLQRANVSRNRIEPDTPSLRCFSVPLEDGGRAFVLYNYGEEAVKATIGNSITVELAANSPGLVVIDGKGRLTTVEAQGVVARNSKHLMIINGHAIVQSLDGKDLVNSNQLLILPFPGRDSLPPRGNTKATLKFSSLAGMRIELGELQGGRWRCLERLKADKSGFLRYDEEQSLNMIIASKPGEFAEAVKKLELFGLGSVR